MDNKMHYLGAQQQICDPLDPDHVLTLRTKNAHSGKGLVMEPSPKSSEPAAS